MSLSLRVEESKIHVRYSDGERLGDVIIDLEGSKVIILKNINLRIIFEASSTPLAQKQARF